MRARTERNDEFSAAIFFRTSGALIVGFSISERDAGEQRTAARLQALRRSNQLDSWLAIAADGSVTAYSGKEELGQGISVAQMQLVAEELAYLSIASS